MTTETDSRLEVLRGAAEHALKHGNSSVAVNAEWLITLLSRTQAVEKALEEVGVLGEIASERQRQVAVEGWTPGHDDAHTDFEMARAATCYALMPWRRTEPTRFGTDRPLGWPWADQWWKPTTDRRDLIKAAALIVAEIERLDRTPS